MSAVEAVPALPVRPAELPPKDTCLTETFLQRV
jgi:hypothetical protein